MKLKNFTLALIIILIQGCAYLLEENINETEPSVEYKQTNNTKIEKSISQLKDSVKIYVKLLSRDELQIMFSTGRTFDKKDFEKILKDEYINYAQGNNAELLSIYNEYIHRREYGYYYDMWGNNLTPKFTPSPFEDSFGKLKYLVFKVKIENLRTDKIWFKPGACVLLDDKRHQFRSLQIEDIIQYETVPYPMRYITPYTLVDPFYAMYLLVTQRRAEISKVVLRNLMLRDEKIYPGVVREGILVFNRPPSEARKLALIIPEIVIYRNGKPDGEVEFKFIFDNPVYQK